MSFTLNGHPYQYDADFLGDWLDVNVLAFLNSALEKEKIKKRFLTVDDFNIQGVVVFFRTPEWAGFSARERSSPSRTAERTREAFASAGPFCNVKTSD